MNCKTLFLITVALLPASLLGQTAIDERKPAEPDGSVEISNVSGSVTIEGWRRSEIEVTGELGRNVERLDFIRDGDHTIIKVVYPRRNRSSGSELNIKLPQDSDVNVTTVSADVDIEKVKGEQRLTTVSGDLNIGLEGDRLYAKTVSGDVDIVGGKQAADVEATSVSGDVTAEFAGEASMNTVSGDLALDGGVMTRVRMKTTNGDMDLVAKLDPNASVEMDTVNGDIDIRFNGSSDFAVDIETLNGDIDTCMGLEGQRKERYGPGRYLRESVGSGARRFHIRTINGDVELCGR